MVQLALQSLVRSLDTQHLHGGDQALQLCFLEILTFFPLNVKSTNKRQRGSKTLKDERYYTTTDY